MRTNVILSHVARAVPKASLTAIILVGLVAGAAFAGGRGGHATSSASLSIPNATFAGTTTATVSGATGLYVRVECSQNGMPNYLSVERTDSAGQATFTMGPTSTWTSGAASCVGQAGHFDRRARWQVDASTTFSVSA